MVTTLPCVLLTTIQLQTVAGALVKRYVWMLATRHLSWLCCNLPCRPVPSIVQMVSWVLSLTTVISAATLMQPLPDLSNWHYGGSTNIANEEVHIWRLFSKKSGKTSTYTFYTTPEGRPVRCVHVERSAVQTAVPQCKHWCSSCTKLAVV